MKILILRSVLTAVLFIPFTQIYCLSNLNSIGIIIDKDGYTNIREKSSSKSKIIGTFSNNEIINYQSSSGEWNQVSFFSEKLNKLTTGYVHSSRIQPLDNTEISYVISNCKKQIVSKGIIELIQSKVSYVVIETDKYGGRSGYIEIITKDKKKSRIKFQNIESLGGYAGIWHTKINDYLVLTKSGDYDGKTIIIDPNGKFIELEGGEFAESNHIILSEQETDCGGALIVFDLKKWKVLAKSGHPCEGYNNYYESNKKIYIEEVETTYSEEEEKTHDVIKYYEITDTGSIKEISKLPPNCKKLIKYPKR